MEQKTVYLVKFDLGYYAKKQPNYEWSYTNDPFLAATFKSVIVARGRGEWGVGLVDMPNRAKPASYIIEKYTVKTVMDFEGVE